VCTSEGIWVGYPQSKTPQERTEWVNFRGDAAQVAMSRIRLTCITKVRLERAVKNPKEI
jgi:hypothetical protein